MYSAVEGKFCGTPICCPSCVHSARIQLVIGNANLIFSIVHSSIPNFTMVQENTLPSSVMIYCRYTRDYTTHISPVTNVTSGGRGYGTAYVLLELYSFYVANIDSWEFTV